MISPFLGHRTTPLKRKLYKFLQERKQERIMILKTKTEMIDKKKNGVDYDILFPWPQDRPPDKNLLQGFMREEEVTRESY